MNYYGFWSKKETLKTDGNGLSHFADENGVYKGEQITAVKKSKQKVTRV